MCLYTHTSICLHVHKGNSRRTQNWLVVRTGTRWLGTEVFETDRQTHTHRDFSLHSLLSVFNLTPFKCINNSKHLFLSSQDC